METKKIKCPVCGNEEFVLIDPPYEMGMDTYILEHTEYYACSECGLIYRFAKGIVDRMKNDKFLKTEDGQKWLKLKQESERLADQIANLEVRLVSLNEELEDENRSIKRDKELKKELKETKEENMFLNQKLGEIMIEMSKLKK